MTPPLALLKQIAGNSLSSTALLITERTAEHTHTPSDLIQAGPIGDWNATPQDNFICFCRDGVWIVHFWKPRPTFCSEGNLVMCPGFHLRPLSLAQERRLVPTLDWSKCVASTPVIFKDIFVSQGGMQGDGKAKTNFFDCLGSDLSTHFFFKCRAGWKGRRGCSCGPLRQKLKGLAPGLTQILDN